MTGEGKQREKRGTGGRGGKNRSFFPIITCQNKFDELLVSNIIKRTPQKEMPNVILLAQRARGITK
jgi:hypothetical protein